jgi:hypothetical protein
VITCEHGDPHPLRCALCRRREDRLAHPEKYAQTRDRDDRPRGVPRPVWFYAEVEAAREKAEQER